MKASKFLFKFQIISLSFGFGFVFFPPFEYFNQYIYPGFDMNFPIIFTLVRQHSEVSGFITLSHTSTFKTIQC